MVYWIILLGILILNNWYKGDRIVYLWGGFSAFIIGAITSILGITIISEILMRLCLIFLLTGFIFSIKAFLIKNE